MKKYLLASYCGLLALAAAAQCPNGLKQGRQNLVKNGDFEQANTEFSSDYVYTTPKPSALVPENTYAVAAEVGQMHYAFSSCGDHSSGKGKMMLVNGSTVPNKAVWRQKICVPKMSLIQFNGWFSNLVSSPPYIELRLNGKMMIDSRDVYLDRCDWVDLGFQWFSGEDTSAVFEIYNNNVEAGDNDFAIDDLSAFVCYSKSTGELGCGQSPFVSKTDTVYIDKNALDENQTLILKDVQFAQSRWDLDSLSKQELDKIAGWLLIYPTMEIELSGHTSNEGDAEKNLTLSRQRVEACQAYILQKGLTPNRVKIQAYGESKPAFDNNNPEGRRKNRRVELKVLKK